MMIGNDEQGFDALRRNETTGRPLGSDHWLTKLENQLGRTLQRQKTGRKRRETQGQFT
jgi:hypothetical protein